MKRTIAKKLTSVELQMKMIYLNGQFVFKDQKTQYMKEDFLKLS